MPRSTVQLHTAWSWSKHQHLFGSVFACLFEKPATNNKAYCTCNMHKTQCCSKTNLMLMNLEKLTVKACFSADLALVYSQPLNNLLILFHFSLLTTALCCSVLGGSGEKDQGHLPHIELTEHWRDTKVSHRRMLVPSHWSWKYPSCSSAWICELCACLVIVQALSFCTHLPLPSY